MKIWSQWSSRESCSRSNGITKRCSIPELAVFAEVYRQTEKIATLNILDDTWVFVQSVLPFRGIDAIDCACGMRFSVSDAVYFSQHLDCSLRKIADGPLKTRRSVFRGCVRMERKTDCFDPERLRKACKATFNHTPDRFR